MNLENFLYDIEPFNLNEGIEDKGIFKAVFMAGHPGAGKTFVLDKIKSGSIEPKWVNTDKFFVKSANLDKLDPESQLKVFREYWTNNWPLVAPKIKTIGKNQMALYINSMLPLACDGTSTNTSLVNRRKGLLESFGYDTSMVFVNTDLETALERASKRERKVDPNFIKDSYQKVNKAKSFYRNLFNDWIEIANSEGELNEQVITRAFNKMSGFYSSLVKNPVGREYIETMKENGWKYLSPNIMDLSEIKSVLNVWYAK